MLIGSSSTFVAAVKLNNSRLCFIRKLKIAYDWKIHWNNIENRFLTSCGDADAVHGADNAGISTQILPPCGQ